MLKIHKMSARVPIGEREQVNDGGDFKVGWKNIHPCF